jgi:hypothetical protein
MTEDIISDYFESDCRFIAAESQGIRL